MAIFIEAFLIGSLITSATNLVLFIGYKKKQEAYNKQQSLVIEEQKKQLKKVSGSSVLQISGVDETKTYVVKDAQDRQIVINAKIKATNSSGIEI